MGDLRKAFCQDGFLAEGELAKAGAFFAAGDRRVQVKEADGHFFRIGAQLCGKEPESPDMPVDCVSAVDDNGVIAPQDAVPSDAFR